MDNSQDTVAPTPTTEAAVTKELSKFQHPSVWKGIWQMANSYLPYIGLWILAIWSLEYSYWLTLPIMVLAAGFLVRIFIIFHDCGHGSFFKSPRANTIVGIISGILTFTPYHYWRNAHAKHHATTANLDKRGYGDVWMMTVDEYKNASKWKRWEYRLYRNPIVMFGLGPLFIMLISNRFVRRKANRAEKLSVYGTNVAIAAIAVTMSLLIGWKAYLMIQLPMSFVSLVAGIWLFYVQHQFDGVYWSRSKEWDFFHASIFGGSYYRLPAILNWFSGNIGYHHVHHLNSRIPNYHLPKCHKEIPVFEKTPTFGFWSGFKSLRFRLWDEENGALIGFRGIKGRRTAAESE